MTRTDAPRRRLWRLYWLETKYEILKNLRLPIFALSTLLFPLMFYLFFGVLFQDGDGSAGASTYLLAGYGAFGVIGASLFGFGVGVATERGQGWLRVKQASPMPPTAYFAAKVAMALAFGLAIVLGLLLLGTTLGGVRLSPGTAAALTGTLLLGSLPFSALGLAIGTWVGPNSAAAVVNLVYLPLAFLGGLWLPVEMLPAFFRDLAPALPTYHLGQLALGALGLGTGEAWTHVLYLLAAAVLFVVVAVIGYRRDEGRTYG